VSRTAATPLTVVVGSGGVGKTTLAAAMAADLARRGHNTLVMTFDPSLRLKDALGVSADPQANEIRVPFDADGELWASLLDARRTFDTLVDRYAPDDRARQRILTNRFYDHLSGSLAGVLEYMASERLFEVASYGKYDRVILDTPPTRQALDFLGAPERIVAFLESGALRIALKPWFDADGSLKATSKLGVLGRNVENFFDRMVGMELLRDMAEFFQAFAPLFDGFKERALEVQRMLRSEDTSFTLVSGPGEQRVADTLFFARKLTENGYRLGPVVVNRVHPEIDGTHDSPIPGDGRALLGWLGRKDHEGVGQLRQLLGGSHPLAEVPLRPDEPTDLDALVELGALLRKSF
jgi:anion-transporting  ArsA/GET3 family ATPase